MDQEEGKAYAKALRWKMAWSIKKPKERLVWLAHVSEEERGMV